MTIRIRRQATALKNFLLKALAPFQGACPAARDVPPPGEALSGRRAVGGDFGRDQAAAGAGGSRFGFSLLLLFALLTGASSAQAAGVLCSEFTNIGTPANPKYLIDGADSDHRTLISSASTLGIDADCTIRNFPASNPLQLTLINFNFEQQQSFIIVFDNVTYLGGMSCQDPTQSDFWMWWVNGSYNEIDSKCQEFLLPVDAIQKLNPVGQTTATVGVPFTYTLTMPVMMKLTSTGYVYENPVTDDAPLSDVHVYDDLTKTGANLTYVGNNAYLKDSAGNITSSLGELKNWGDSKHLEFRVSDIPSNTQLVIELTVVLDNANTVGTQFTNTATWTFDKTMNGIFKDDLPGQNGTTFPPMTVVGAKLVVEKTSTVPNLNVGTSAPFKINVQNTGGSDAWDITVTDNLPAGMCQFDPRTNLTAGIYAADGVTPVSPLALDTDYTLAWTGSPTTTSGCQLTLTTKDTSALAKLRPTQRLIISYDAQLDAGTAPGLAFTNVAGATQWFNAPSSYLGRLTYGPFTLSADGTPSAVDYQDAYTLISATQGYFFLKSVEDLTTGANPATTAFAGDKLRYTLQIQNFTLPALNNITIVDDLGALNAAGAIVPGSLSVVSNDLPAGTLAVDPIGGTNGAGAITISGLNLGSNEQYQLQFDVTLASTLTNADISNQASLTGTDEAGLVWSGVSDDPYSGGPELLSAGGDATTVTVRTPGPLSKANANPAKTTATIGEQFTYTITVPRDPVDVPLYDVRILDNLAADGVDIRLVSATLVSGGTWTLSNTGGSDTNLVIEDTVTGIDIPAGGQAVIEITVELLNTSNNYTGQLFANTASYTYNRANGVVEPIPGGAATTDKMAVVEPAITTGTKTWRYVGSKADTAPAEVGDVIEYVITVTNTGNSTAFDTNIGDILPASVSLVPNSATAVIGVNPVATFVKNPITLASGGVAWGRENGDGSLDIPPGESLVLTYQVTVLSVGLPIDNSVYVDWTSRDGATAERTGVGCQSVVDPLNDYCFGPVTASVATLDTNTIIKSVLSDSYAEVPPSTPPSFSVVRVGDTATYQLTLKLHEGVTRDVRVTDLLPDSMQLQGAPVITTSAGAIISYTALTTTPTPLDTGATGKLVWSFGDITNTSQTYAGDGTDALDELIITYVASVIPDAQPAGVAHVPTINVTNFATLSYTGGDPSSADPLVHDRLTTTQVIEIRQPVISAISKTGEVLGPPAAGGDGLSGATAYQVDIVNNTMKFRLRACNTTGLAPAYNVLVTDQLPVELNEGTLVGPVVKIGTGTNSATATTVTPGPTGDYVYTLNGRQMRIAFNDSRPINPGECVFVEYDLGFNNNIAPNTTWNNSAQVQEYYSLPTQSGRAYGPVGPAAVYMTNLLALNAPTKAIAQPSSTSVVTIGDEVHYTITVPGTPVNATLAGVVVSDLLDPALVYLGATAQLQQGATVIGGLALDDSNTAGQSVNLTLDPIPAGQQAVITLRTRVADNATAIAGYAFDNSASYVYNGETWTSTPTGPLTVVEPALVPTKSVSPASPATPTAGDILTYTITLPAQTAANTSQAFDLSVLDTLGAGLGYVDGSAAISGVAVAAPLPEPAKGTNGAQQTLTWAGLDIPYNTQVTITYNVQVMSSVVPGQTLSNSAVIGWTSLDTDVADERSYSATVATSLTVADTASLTKAVSADGYDVAGYSTATDRVARVGDTVDYQLTLNLQEGTTPNVSVTDQLPAGLAFVELVSVVPGTNVSHGAVSAPSAGATGLLAFSLGDVVHTPDADALDSIVITYRARVLKDTLAHQASISPLTNTATLSYTGSPAGATRLQASADITVLQPVITTLTKSDRNGLTSPANIVDIANTTMAFRLHACNTGAAPAYSLEVTDQLATQFDETSISIVGVAVAGVATGNYVYTLAGRTMTFVVNEPVYPNQCVDIDYDIGFNTDFGANQAPWNNAFTVSEYWSLPVPTAAEELLAQLYAPVVLPAPFVMTNNATTTPPTKSLVSSPEATIGGEVIYRIAVPGAVSNAGVLYDVVVTDTLDPNLDYISATVTGVSGTVSDTSTQATPTAPSQMKLSITEIQPGQQAVIELHARVRNVAGAQQGVDVNNTVSYTYANTAGGTAEPALTSSEIVTVNIVEPHIATIDKSADKTTATAGELVRYTVTLTASGGTDASDAFDVTVIDTLAPGLEYAGGAAVSGTGNVIGAPTISGDGVNTPYTLVWSLADGSDIDIAEGSAITISYDVRVLDSVLANQALANSVVAQWTSIDGALPYVANADERNGTDGIGQLNDYVTPAATWTVTTPDTNTIAKDRTSDTYGAGDADVRIGDTVEYTLRLSLQEGTLDNLVVVDTLPQGLEFAGIVSVNGNAGAGTPTTYTAAAPFVHNPISAASVTPAGVAANGPTKVTWSLGSVTNQLNDGASNDFVIVYRARVLNNVFPHTDLDVALNNTVTMSYDTATGRVTQSDLDTVITALQPLLTVSKSAASSVNNDTEVVAGEVITYTVDIVNSGTAPAYDTMLQDTLPVGLRLGGVATSSVVLLNTATGATVSSPGPVVPAYDPATGVAVWDFDNGNPAYAIPVGQTLRVTYTVTVDGDVGAGLTLTNTAQATHYYSLDDNEVSPTDSGIYREAYASTTTSASVTTPTAGVLSKATPAQTSAAIGEEFTYTITVPATPIATALQDVRIFDNLAVGGADLRFVGAEMVSPGAGPLAGSVDAATGVVEIENTDGSGVDIPAMGQIQVAVTVVLLNTGKNMTPGLSFTNRAWYTYSNGTSTFGSDATTGATSGAMTVAHPTLTMRKTGPAAMRVGTPATFTLDLQNTSTSDAWNVTVTDWLPNPAVGGMCDAAVTNVSATIFEADGTTTVLPLVEGTHYDPPSFTVSGTEPRCEFVLTTKAPAVVEPGQRLIVTYSVALDADNIDGSTLTNVAGATGWLSANPAGGVYQTYTAALTDGTVGTLDHQDAYSVTVQGAILTSQKSVTKLITDQSGVTTELPGATATPGDRLRYTITIENTTDIALSNFSLVDEIDRLNAVPMFQPGSIGIVSVPAGASPVISGGTLNVDGLNIAGNETLTVVFDATLAPVIASGAVVLNQGQLTLGGAVFGNTDDPAITGTEDPTRTVITSAPQFQVFKTSQDTTGDTNVLMAGDTLHYTITAKNIGTANATGVVLKDLIPAYTTYVANTTRLNGVLVADSSVGVSPLQNGMLINAPEDTTPGAMRADAAATLANVATVSFDVVINSDVLDGTTIANQGFVRSSGVLVDKPSDDPATTVLDDPTRDIVGNLPLVDAQKIVSIQDDKGTPGVAEPGDVLRYTITVNNSSAIPATAVVLTDAVPGNTTYVADSVMLNGIAVGRPDGGVSPLIAGVQVNSAGSASGTIAAGASAVVTFDVVINTGVADDTVISNQGYVVSSGLPSEPTDADGNDANGDQPTTIVVGSAQQLLITKEVFVVDGGVAQAGGQLEYVVRVTNTGLTPASNVVITDDLTSLVGASYVAGSAKLNGSATGVNYAAPVLTATVGDLATGASATLSFRVLVDGALSIGSTLTNRAEVSWGAGLTANSSVSIDIGGIPGSAMLNGHAWHDTNFNNVHDTNEVNLAGWTVALYRNNVQLGSVTTDIGGLYSFSGIAPSTTAADQYELRFTAPGATATTAKLGLADSTFSATPFTDGMQQISNIAAVSGSNLQNLNLPLDPNGVVFDSVARAPIAGATVTMARAGSTTGLPSSCFDDPVQQNQVTLATGFYKFDLNYSDASCPRGGDYVIRVTPPGTGYVAGPSRLIPPVTSETTAAYDVASCANDAVAATASYCEAQVSEFAPAVTVPASQANHYLHMTLSNPVPEDSQLFNNHIAVDPTLENAVTISKTSALVNVSRGELVPYVITVTNTMTSTLQNLEVVDTFPPGFKYVEGSSRVDGLPLEPVKTNRTLSWGNMQLDSNAKREIKLLFIVGSGVSEGQYVNRAQMFSTLTGSAVSGEASATVRVVPDPTFDCTDVIGKVFDDANRNGYQDEGERGLPGVRVATARGLLITTDDHGRFHITCAVVPDEVRGSNFILKVDDRTLPTGYRITTENPRVQRATRGKMMKFNFGATIHKLVRIDVANGVFEPGTTDMRIQWKPRMELLMGELKKGASILRLAYMAEIEDEKLVEIRLKSLKQEIERLWAQQNGPYELVIETEVFWRTGAPPSRSALK